VLCIVSQPSYALTISNYVNRFDSDELNRYIIQQLHRHGVDLCNKALTRLLSKRERRENEGKLTASQKKLCRITAVDVWDVRVVELCDLVRDVDSKVTSFQKEVEKELQSASDNHNVRTQNDNGVDAIPADHVHGEGSGMPQFKKKKRSVERDWDDHHPHASRKSKSSCGMASRPGLKLKRRHPSRRTSDPGGDTSRCDEDSNKRGRLLWSRRNEATVDIEDELSPPAISHEEDADFITNFDSADIDFLGDTDDSDDDHGKYSSITGLSRSFENKQFSKRTTPSASIGGTASGPQRQSRPISETMSGWLDKQQECSEMGAGESPGWQPRGNGRSNRQASTNENHHASRKFSRNAAAAQRQPATKAANAPRTQRVLVSNGRLNQNQRHGGGTGSSKNDPTTASIRVEIPDALSADVLFDLISTKDFNRPVEQQEIDLDNNRSLNDLCQDLRDRYPANLPSSRGVLANLTTAVFFKSGDDLRKDEVITIFQTLLRIFQKKCTTLRDIIQTNPEVATFQISCWCLAFQMLGKKSTEKLAHGDGLPFKIFANYTTLAKHMLLQVIDVLYSQLLWEEYGQTPSLDSRVLDELRSLCVSIGSFVPLLPSVCGLLTNIISEPRWHLSLSHEHKENEPEMVLFVTAIDPEMHRRFITSGEVSDYAQGMCSC
jgi:hypothetical protein